MVARGAFVFKSRQRRSAERAAERPDGADSSSAGARYFCVPKPGMASFFSSLARSQVAAVTMTR